jgi:uncharacterized protein YjbI with pentapeptide repeats
MNRNLIVVVISATLVGVMVLIYYAWFSHWPWWVLILLLIILFGIILILIRVGYTAQWTRFSDKTLWNWLKLLIIPFVLALGGFWFSAQQNLTSLQVSGQQHQADLQIAATRYANDQQLALDQQRQTTLKTCIDDIRDLLLNRGLKAPNQTGEVRVVARGEVLTALRQLDGERKGLLIQFLSEAGLISIKPMDNKVIILLDNADLEGASLSGAGLEGASLRSANLRGAQLNDAHLPHADLTGADLNGTNLSHADLSGANLGCAELSDGRKLCTQLNDADLSGADLFGAIVTQAQLNEATSLQDTTMPDGSKHP